jgi:hypothetical protein
MNTAKSSCYKEYSLIYLCLSKSYRIPSFKVISPYKNLKGFFLSYLEHYTIYWFYIVIFKIFKKYPMSPLQKR